MRWVLGILLGCVLMAAPVLAHELRPGFLELTQTDAQTYSGRFKVPARGDLRLRLNPRFPSECRWVDPPRAEPAGTAFIDRFTVTCADGLKGRSITIDGLDGTFTDVVARVVHRDGTVQTARLTPDQPAFTVIGAPTWSDTAWTYFVLGVQHILLGLDHLLFVLALLLLVRGVWPLVKTITAFTAAHSITLALSALGLANLPQTPVEAVVALSIMFVAAEVVRRSRHNADLPPARSWLAAFGFGLLHGLGFGGALREIGLPQADVPLALLTFNLGVEAGQLLFIAAVLALGSSLARLLAIRPDWLPAAAAYGTGSIAAAWFFQRIAFM